MESRYLAERGCWIDDSTGGVDCINAAEKRSCDGALVESGQRNNGAHVQIHSATLTYYITPHLSI